MENIELQKGKMYEWVHITHNTGLTPPVPHEENIVGEYIGRVHTERTDPTAPYGYTYIFRLSCSMSPMRLVS